MRTLSISLALLAGGLLLPPMAWADHFQRKAVRSEVKQLHGTWKAISVEGFDNQAKAAEDMKSVRLDIHRRTMEARWGDNKSAEASFRIDPTAAPQTIDITVTRGPEAVQGKTFHGVFTLEGDTLQIAYSDPGQARPTSMATQAAQGVHRVTLKKEARK